ncbi:MAG: ABC transporter ATP-binding protein [Sphingomonadales bacterium]
MNTVIEFKNLKRTYIQGNRTLEILKNINLSVKKGEVLGLLGQSGSGKSTLLHLAGLLEFPTHGEIIIESQYTNLLNDQDRTKIRRNSLGFVYQFHHLLPEFTALENVLLPLLISNISKKKAKIRASKLLKTMGLIDRETHKPAELSGGEQQRVAIARALANNPSLLLADEPTGNLDEATADRVMTSLIETVHTNGFGAIIATHNMALASRMDRCVQLKEGRLVEIE